MSPYHLEKLYQYQHPRHVAQFDAVLNEADSIGYWVSRHWLRGECRSSVQANRILILM